MSFSTEKFEQTLLYGFYIYGLISVGAAFYTILRNFNSLGNPLYYRTLDIYMFTYILTIILGGFCTYRLILYYRFTYSIQYLLLTVYIFGTAVMLFLWHLWGQYFSPIGIDPSLIWTNFVEPEIIIGQLNYYLGMIALIIYTVKLRPWREYHILLKILIIWMLYEIICQGFLKYPVGRTLLWLDILPFEYWLDPQFLFNLISPGYHLLILLPETFSGFDDPYKVLSYAIPLFLVYNYLVTKPEVKTKKVTISRIFWIVFGISSIVLEIVNLFDVTNLLGLAKVFEWYQLFSVRQAIILAGLVLLLERAPEVLLITRAQIFRVKNLYQRIERGELGPQKADQTAILDYKAQIRSYLAALPPDLKTELQ